MENREFLSPREIMEKAIESIRNGIDFKMIDYKYSKQDLLKYKEELKKSTIEDKLFYCKYTLARRINLEIMRGILKPVKSKEEFDIYSWYQFIVELDGTIEEILETINDKSFTREKCIDLIKKIAKGPREKILEKSLEFQKTGKPKNEKIPYMLIELIISSQTVKEYNSIVSKLKVDLGIDINSNIDEIISKYQITKEKYNEIREARKRQIENEKTKKPENTIEFFSKMTDNELKEYLKTHRDDEIITKLRKLQYKETIGPLARFQVRRINDINKKTNLENKKSQSEIRKQQLIELYEEMLNNKIWDKTEFIRRNYAKYGYSYPDDMQRYIKCSEFKLTDDEKKYYKRKFDETRREEFKKIEPLIEEIIGGNADIIDYYLKIKMPIERFRKLTLDIMSTEKQRSLSKFIGCYFDKHFLMPTIPNYTTGSIERYRSIEVTPEKEQLTLYFLNKYNIPDNFFVFALSKLECDSKLKQEIKTELEKQQKTMTK